MFGRPLKDYLVIIPAALIAIIFHEVAHGVAAMWLGDKTAKNAGRLTLNPISHIDPIGLICMIFVGFGWAKPVPVNPMNFKNRKVGMAITALAGPVSNFILGFVLMFISVTIATIFPESSLSVAFVQFIFITARLSIGLGVFNLIPIPPLDGSKVLQIFMPHNMIAKMYNYQAYFQIGLIVLLMLGALDGVIFTAQNAMIGWLAKGVQQLCLLVGIL